MSNKRTITSEVSEIYDDELNLVIVPSNESYQAILDGIMIHSSKSSTIRTAHSYCVDLSLNKEIDVESLNGFIQTSLKEL